MAFLAAGQGGVKGDTAQTAATGNLDVKAATGNKTINVGGNPNVQTALQSPYVLIAVAAVVAVWLWRRK